MTFVEVPWQLPAAHVDWTYGAIVDWNVLYPDRSSGRASVEAERARRKTVDRRRRRAGDARVARNVARHVAAVVHRRTVLDPLPDGVVAARRRLEDGAAGVADVGRDGNLRPVEGLHGDRERADVLGQDEGWP